MTVILSNVIPLLLILYFIRDGWQKGALYMLLSLIRLFIIYYLARFLSRFLTDYLLTVPNIREKIATMAITQESFINQLPGISLLFSGNTALISTENIAWGVIYGICFVVVFIILSIIFSRLLSLSRAVNHVFIIGWINQTVGALEGLVFGTFVTMLLINIVAYLFSLFGYPNTAHVILGSWLPQLFYKFI